MPLQKLTIVPVTLHTEKKLTPGTPAAMPSLTPVCTVKTAGFEISFFNGADEHMIQTVLKEMKCQ